MLRRIRPRMALALLATLAAMAACAPTPYRPADSGGGYHQIELEPQVYVVSFLGNDAIDAETIRTYWLYRCAELTIEKGHAYFVILRRSQARDGAIHLATARTLDAEGPTLAAGRTIFIPLYIPEYQVPVVPNMPPVPKGNVIARIRMFSDANDPDLEDAYEARAVIEELGPRIRRP